MPVKSVAARMRSQRWSAEGLACRPFRLAKAEKRQDNQDDDYCADDVYDAVHEIHLLVFRLIGSRFHAGCRFQSTCPGSIALYGCAQKVPGRSGVAHRAVFLRSVSPPVGALLALRQRWLDLAAASLQEAGRRSAVGRCTRDDNHGVTAGLALFTGRAGIACRSSCARLTGCSAGPG